MGKLHVDELRSGMVLEADVYGIQGRKLFPAGVALEEQQIAVMKAWGVTEAEVQGLSRKDVAQASTVQADHLARARRHVDGVFEGIQEGRPFLEELYRIAVDKTAVRMAVGDFSPLDASTLAVMQERGQELEPEVRNISAEDLVNEEVNLFTFPDVYHRILEELKSPASTARRLGEVVSTDPTLTARILRLVNSPCYGFASSVDSIERAVAILGVNELVSLAMTITAMGCFEDMESDVISMRYFWEHSFSCGVLAKLIAGTRRGLPEERFFVGGLLHDIGTLLLVRRFPCAMSRAYMLSRERKVPLEVAERAVLGYDHAEVGSLLLQAWGIPESLVLLVRQHHDPVAVDDYEATCVLGVADVIAKALRNEDYAAWPLLDTPDPVLQALELTPSLLESLVSLHSRHVEDVRSIFIGDV